MGWFDRLAGWILKVNGLQPDGATALESTKEKDGAQWSSTGDKDDTPKPHAAGPRPSADGTPYTIYTTDYDEEVSAGQLDAALTHTIAGQELERRWEKVVEAAEPEMRRATKSFEEAISGVSEASLRDSTVTLLVDHSGSMKGYGIEAAAVTAATLTAALLQHGVRIEILGFTTRSWKGGRSRQRWLEHDRAPSQPGRLCDLRHIIYRSADSPAADGTPPFKHMLRRDLLRENIDGESLQWAVGRIRSRPEHNKLLIVVSDGAPVDDSTNAHNPPTMLADHLHRVAVEIETDGDVTLHAIGVGHDPSVFYRSAVMVSKASHLPAATMHSIANWLCGRPPHQSAS